MIELEKNTLTKKIKTKEDELNEKLVKLEDNQMIIEKLSLEKELLNKNLQNVKGTLGKIQSKLEEKEGEAQGLLSKTFELEGKYSGLGLEAAKYKSDLEKEGRRGNALSEEKEKLAGKLEDLNKNLTNLNQEKKYLENQLKDTLEKNKEKYQLCDALDNRFKAAGVQAIVDPEKAEVIIPFNNSYFGYDSDTMTLEMKEMISKALPIFAKTVFEKGGKHSVGSVELVGFASPVFQGEQLDVSLLDDFHWKGMDYNMDLSYRRARSIFNYIFNPSELNFNYQDKLLKITKISSNSYIASDLKRLPEDQVKDIPAYLSKGRQICKQFDCAAWHKVAIKFQME